MRANRKSTRNNKKIVPQSAIMSLEWCQNYISGMKLPCGMSFGVEKSDRSETVYVSFGRGRNYYATLRISDHDAPSPHATFLVIPEKPITYVVKNKLNEALQKTILHAQKKMLNADMRYVERSLKGVDRK